MCGLVHTHKLVDFLDLELQVVMKSSHNSLVPSLITPWAGSAPLGGIPAPSHRRSQWAAWAV